MDSPAEYVAKLEEEVRALRAASVNHQRELNAARLEALDLDARIRAMTSAASSAALTGERALTRVQEWKPIVDAAVKYYESDGRGSTHRDLCSAVELEIERRESIS